MQYPEFLTIEKLEKTHNQYGDLNSIWNKIDDLLEGGKRIWKERKKYVPMIPGEKQDVYQNRLDRFTYDPVMSQCTQEISRKFLTGTVSIAGLPKDEKSIFYKFWESFRDETDSDSERNSEILLANKIFTQLVNYGRTYIHIEQNGESTGNIASDITSGIIPYVNIYHPSTVINWGEGWFKLRFVEPIEDPFSSDDLHIIKWLFIDDIYSALYSQIVKLNEDGSIDQVFVNGKLQGFDPKSFLVPIVENYPIEHNFGECPLIMQKVAPSEWLANKSYLRQLEHLRELNSKHSMNSLLYIQRTFKPRVDREDDLEFVTETVDSGLESGNPYILDVESFSFSEPSGTASNMLAESLNGIKNSIRSFYGLTGGETTKATLERSGASKEMDFIPVRDILNSFGNVIIPLLNRIYWIVGKAISYTDDINISGLSNFQVNILSADIKNALDVQEIETQIAPTALQIFYGRISTELAGSASPEQKLQIASEIENIFKAPISMLKSSDSDDQKTEKLNGDNR